MLQANAFAIAIAELASVCPFLFAMHRASMHAAGRAMHAAAAAAHVTVLGAAPHSASAAMALCAAAMRPATAAMHAAAPARAFSSLRAGSSRSLLPLPAAGATSAVRGFCSTRPLLGLEEFFLRQQPGRTGRSWQVRDLRMKGWHDLHRLWFVLLKERNMLLTYRYQCRKLGERMEGEHRLRKCRQSMSAIKHVLGERYRHYKERTDQQWVDRQARKRRQRSRVRVALAKRRSPTFHVKGNMVPGGLKPWQKTNRQKYAYLKPRAEGEAPPTGVLPERMTDQRSGHGQAPADLLLDKIKRDKEYV